MSSLAHRTTEGADIHGRSHLYSLARMSPKPMRTSALQVLVQMKVYPCCKLLNTASGTDLLSVHAGTQYKFISEQGDVSGQLWAIASQQGTQLPACVINRATLVACPVATSPSPGRDLHLSPDTPSAQPVQLQGVPTTSKVSLCFLIKLATRQCSAAVGRTRLAPPFACVQHTPWCCGRPGILL